MYAISGMVLQEHGASVPGIQLPGLWLAAPVKTYQGSNGLYAQNMM